MKTAKIIALFAFILNGSLSTIYLNHFFRFRPIFQELETQMQAPWVILSPPIFAIGSLGYFFDLRNKDKEGEKVKFALLISILLFLAGGAYNSIIATHFIGPIYNLMSHI